MTGKVHYTKPSITELEVQYATDAAANGWGDHCYDYIHKFEAAFAKHLDVRFALATSSCTGALHMGLSALGIGPGDEVILADTNWIATAAPITYLGATPVFVDILPRTWCMDPTKVEKAITPATKAIIAVHLYGNLCEMDALLEIGNNHGIPVIEDAAEAVGSVYKEKHAGSMGAFGTFSFHGTKTITTGEGGMFVTNDENIYDTVLTLSNHGRSCTQNKQFWPDMVGFKYKMSNIQAAIGCAQMERIETLINRKKQIFKFYECALEKLPVSMNPELDETCNGFWMPNIVINEDAGKKSDGLLEMFKQEDVDARVFFWPLSSLPFFNNVGESKNWHSYKIPERAANLPSYHDISDEDMGKVVDVIKRYLE